MNTKFLTACVLAAVGFASPAGATIVDITYVGLVSSGYDQTGVFGPAGTDLTDETYEAHYVFDTTRGTTFSSAALNYGVGGSQFGVASPVISASVTIGGISASIGGTYIGSIEGTSTNSGYQTHDAEDISTDQYGNIVADSFVTNFIAEEGPNFKFDGIRLTSSITEPFTFTVPDLGAVASGTFQILDHDSDEYAFGNASICQLTVAVVPVPEASTWAMMLAGFAGLGFVAWRRTSKGPISAIA
jgi:PEP-CTERM motif